MEWVTTTGKTVELAKEAALDELGVDESEAEFEVLEEPKSSFFKLSRSEARVRARVLPKTPRPKQERRNRRGRNRRAEGQATDTGAPTATKSAREDPAPAPDAPTSSTAEADEQTERSDRPKRRRNRSRSRSGSNSGGHSATQEGSTMTDDVVSVDEQADMIGEFLEGLLGAFAIEGEVEREQIDESTIELGIRGGDDLGLLIGPKGQTLTAVHELSRTVLQRRATGRHDGRVRIDIGGYRRRRAEALARFVTGQAEAVIDEGVARALEPMNAVDRKIVHDTVNEIDGVSTTSEGADPHRRVIIVPAGGAG